MGHSRHLLDRPLETRGIARMSELFDLKDQLLGTGPSLERLVVLEREESEYGAWSWDDALDIESTGSQGRGQYGTGRHRSRRPRPLHKMWDQDRPLKPSHRRRRRGRGRGREAS